MTLVTKYQMLWHNRMDQRGWMTHVWVRRGFLSQPQQSSDSHWCATTQLHHIDHPALPQGEGTLFAKSQVRIPHFIFLTRTCACLHSHCHTHKHTHSHAPTCVSQTPAHSQEHIYHMRIHTHWHCPIIQLVVGCACLTLSDSLVSHTGFQRFSSAQYSLGVDG